MARKMIFGTYDTQINGPWTLAGWTLSAAEYETNLVTVPGRHGQLDLSTALTDGEPRYSNRTLTVTLERSDGTRLDREAAINTLINWLDGWRMDIKLPDDEAHYITGRVHVVKNYNDPAHASVTVTASCDPWRYNNNETIINLTAEEEAQTARLSNAGRRTAVPVLTISGDDAAVLLVFGTASWALGAGVYQLPDLIIPQGGENLTYSGTGNVKLVYREAVL